jgi:hypothetical protein
MSAIAASAVALTAADKTAPRGTRRLPGESSLPGDRVTGRKSSSLLKNPTINAEPAEIAENL